MESEIVQKAMSIPSKQKGRISELHISFSEEEELALAWIQGKVTSTQAAILMYGEENRATRSGNVLYRFASALRRAYNEGKLEIK